MADTAPPAASSQKSTSASRSSTQRQTRPLAAVRGDVERRSQVVEDTIAVQANVSKQQESIHALTDENEQLKRELAAVSGAAFSYVEADKLATLQGEVDAYERHLRFERMRKNQLTKNYQLARIDLMHSRKMKGGVNAEREHAEAVQRQVEVLESRLDQALVKFNDALARNRDLREQIDVIREERRVFQRVCKRLESDLVGVKSAIASNLEQANYDYEERDTYQQQLEQLTKTAAEERQKYEEELKALDAAMREIREMREEQQRLQLEITTRQYEVFSRNDEGLSTPNLTPRPEVRKDRTAGVGVGAGMGGGGLGTFQGDSAPDRPHSEMAEDSDTALDEAIALVRTATNVQDMEVAHHQYVRCMEKSFSLYNYVNDLTSEKSALSAAVETLRTRLADPVDARRRKNISSLEVSIEATEGQLRHVQELTQQRRRTANAALQAALGITRNLQCPPETAEVYANSVDSTERVLVELLAIIEQRADEVMFAFRRHHLLIQSDRVTPARAGAPGGRGQGHGNPRIGTGNGSDIDAETTDGGAAPAVKGPGARTDVREDGVTDRTAETMPITETPAYTMMSRSFPIPANKANSVREAVLQMGLPSSSYGVDNNDGPEEVGDDRVVSHKALRQQMGVRLQAKRDREERTNRKRRDREFATNAAVSGSMAAAGAAGPMRGGRTAAPASSQGGK